MVSRLELREYASILMIIDSVTIHFTGYLQQEHRRTQDELVKTFYDLFACVI